MIRHNQVGPVADKQPAGIHAALVKRVDFTNEHGRVNHHAITDNANSLGRKNTGRDQVQLELTVGVNYSVSGIITTGKANYHSCFFSEQVNYFTLPLISPLGSKNSNNWHYFLLSGINTSLVIVSAANQQIISHPFGASPLAATS